MSFHFTSGDFELNIFDQSIIHIESIFGHVLHLHAMPHERYPHRFFDYHRNGDLRRWQAGPLMFDVERKR